MGKFYCISFAPFIVRDRRSGVSHTKQSMNRAGMSPDRTVDWLQATAATTRFLLRPGYVRQVQWLPVLKEAASKHRGGERYGLLSFSGTQRAYGQAQSIYTFSSVHTFERCVTKNYKWESSETKIIESKGFVNRNCVAFVSKKLKRLTKPCGILRSETHVNQITGPHHAVFGPLGKHISMVTEQKYPFVGMILHWRRSVCKNADFMRRRSGRALFLSPLLRKSRAGVLSLQRSLREAVSGIRIF